MTGGNNINKSNRNNFALNKMIATTVKIIRNDWVMICWIPESMNWQNSKGLQRNFAYLDRRIYVDKVTKFTLLIV
jgi:hypothetical protein